MPDDIPSRPCRTCRATIYFIEGPAGNQMVVQKVRSVYAIETSLPGLEPGQPKLTKVRSGESWVSHFETCPDADLHNLDHLGQGGD